VVYSGTQVEDTFGNEKHADLDNIQPEGTSSSPEEMCDGKERGWVKEGGGEDRDPKRKTKKRRNNQ
jgi:hypothetical protein